MTSWQRQKHEFFDTGIFVRAVCEACGHSYSYSAAMKTVSRGMESARAQVRAHVAANGLPSRPCPKCGYVQSWNVKARKRECAWMGAVIAFASCLLMWSWKGSDALSLTRDDPYLPWLAASHAMLVLGPLTGYEFAGRNRRYIRDHGEPAPPKSPTFGLSLARRVDDIVGEG